jgi:hypothetical protein
MVLAHYWGIDEIGIFLIPAIIAVVGLRWAEKKSKARAEQRAEPDSNDQEVTDVK